MLCILFPYILFLQHSLILFVALLFPIFFSLFFSFLIVVDPPLLLSGICYVIAVAVVGGGASVVLWVSGSMRILKMANLQIENLEDLLKEKDNQVDMARARMTAMQAHHCSSEGALSSLEEAISDKEKQINQLRDQRDRAEQEKHEERELHERELTEYKMKLHTLESEVEKLGVRLDRAQAEKDKLEAKLESSQSELGKSKAELDRVQGDAGKSSIEWESAKQRISRLEMENERLKSENERLRLDFERSQTTYGRSQINVTQDAERLQERLDKAQVMSLSNNNRSF